MFLPVLESLVRALPTLVPSTSRDTLVPSLSMPHRCLPFLGNKLISAFWRKPVAWTLFREEEKPLHNSNGINLLPSPRLQENQQRLLAQTQLGQHRHFRPPPTMFLVQIARLIYY